MAALLLTLGLFDHRWGMFDDTTIGLLKLGSALLAVAALLASPRLGPRALPVSAGVAAVASLGTTVALHLVSARSVGENGIPPTEPYGLTEPAALLGLLTLVVWRGKTGAGGGDSTGTDPGDRAAPARGGSEGDHRRHGVLLHPGGDGGAGVSA
ncbi:hypothetical protein ACRAWF_20905 [Streptomyces sp. L7]